jgi:hypothetical protein
VWFWAKGEGKGFAAKHAVFGISGWGCKFNLKADM